MGVALLLITHDDIGSSLLATAVNMMGVSPLAIKNLVITKQMDIEQGLSEARRMCAELDEGDGILIVTDMYGSTPSNIASRLIENNTEEDKIIVTGVNLPMIVRIMNYASLSLPELARKACLCASDSIFVIDKFDSCDPP